MPLDWVVPYIIIYNKLIRLKFNYSQACVPHNGLKFDSAVGHAGHQKRKIMKKQYLIMIALVFGIGLFFTGQVQAQELWDSNVNHIFNTNTGNVGIGTDNPVQKLDVNGNIVLGQASQIFVRRTPDNALHDMFTFDGLNDIIINRSSLVDGLISGVVFGIGEGKRYELRNSQNHVIMRVWEGSQRMDYDGEISVGKDRAFSATRQDGSRQELFVLDGMDNIILNRSALLGGGESSLVMGVGAGRRFEIRNSANAPVLRINEANGLMTLAGKIVAKEIEVKLDVWPDFVFSDDYNLMSIHEVESFIRENRHLPNVPSEAEVLENGANLGQMTSILLQKVEELTLYMIELNNQNEELKARIAELEK